VLSLYFWLLCLVIFILLTDFTIRRFVKLFFITQCSDVERYVSFLTVLFGTVSLVTSDNRTVNVSVYFILIMLGEFVLFGVTCCIKTVAYI
jgi:predicted ABC-type exoprotein transport system permease subunit